MLHLGAVLEVDLGDGTDDAEHGEDDGEQRDGAEETIDAVADLREKQGREHEFIAPGGATHLLGEFALLRNCHVSLPVSAGLRWFTAPEALVKRNTS